MEIHSSITKMNDKISALHVYRCDVIWFKIYAQLKIIESHLSVRDNETLLPELQLAGGPLSSCLSLCRDSKVV